MILRGVTLRSALCFKLCLLLGIAAISGCSSTGLGMTAVSGTVTLDGKPVGPGTVAFAPTDGSGNTATGNVDQSGRFEMSVRKPGDGVLPGSYKVAVTIVDKPAHGDEKGNLIPPTYLSPDKYMNPETSGFTITVEKDKSQSVKFEMKK
jgi:hypothetical protein